MSKAQVQSLIEKARTSTNRSAVFAEFSKLTGRRPNSIRNFYYTYLSTHPECGEKKSFCRFRKDDTRELVRNIIINSSQGVPVRATCMAMAGGEKTKHLRLQNKYRAVLKKEPHIIHRVVAGLEEEGYVVINPLTRNKSPDKTARIIHMTPRTEDGLNDTDLMNLLMGFVRLVQNTATNDQIERLKNQITSLKRELELVRE